MRSTRFLPLLSLLTLLPACATLNSAADRQDVEAGVRGGAPVVLSAIEPNTRLYVNGSATPARIVTVPNTSFGGALKNGLRQTVAKGAAAPGQTYTWTETSEFAPAIYLPQKGTHSVRIVRPDGKEATVTVKPKMKKGMFLVDFCCTMLIGLVVDAATSEWNGFDDLNVSAAFPDGGARSEIMLMTSKANALLALQKNHFATKGRYAAKLSDLGVKKIEAPYQIAIKQASEKAFTATLGRSDRKGKNCVLFDGQPAARPQTLKDKASPSRPGELVCDT